MDLFSQIKNTLYFCASSYFQIKSILEWTKKSFIERHKSPMMKLFVQFLNTDT